MKFLFVFIATLAAFSVISPTAFAIDFFPSDIFCERVEGANKSQAFNRLAGKIATRHSAMIGREIEAAYSIGPIGHAIISSDPIEICASAIALTKNIYGYHEYLITFTLVMANQDVRSMPILFQASSVQAHHGLGVNPWSGVPRSGLLALAEKEFSNLDFHNTSAVGLRQLLDEGLPKHKDEKIEEGSVSIVPILDSSGEAKYYLVGEYFRIPNQNIYLEVSGARGLVLKRSNSGWQMSAVGSLYGFYQAIDQLKKDSAPLNNSNEEFMKKLIEISK